MPIARLWNSAVSFVYVVGISVSTSASCNGGGGGGSDDGDVGDDNGAEYTYYADADGDGFGDRQHRVKSDEESPPDGTVHNDVDCADDDPGIFPEAMETCNGVDDNCDGSVDLFGQSPCLGLVNLKGSHSLGCGQAADGRLLCWGYDVPTAFVPGVDHPRDYDVGADTVCALQDDAIVCFSPSGHSVPYVVHTDATAESFVPSEATNVLVHETGNEQTSDGASVEVSVIAEGQLVRLSRQRGEEDVIEWDADLVGLAWYEDSSSTCVLASDDSAWCAYQFTDHHEWYPVTPSPVARLLEPGYFISDDTLYELGFDVGGTYPGEEVPGMGSAVELAVNGSESCGRSADGEVACWVGESPVSRAKAIAAVGNSICWIDDSDSLLCNRNTPDEDYGLTMDGSFTVPPPTASNDRRIAGLGLTSGACDNPRDASSLGGRAAAGVDYDCISACGSTLEPEPCESDCVRSLYPVSEACMACVVEFTQCEGESEEGCVDAFADCSGFDL